MYSRLIKPPAHKSFFLFGPRGTGKTTWIRTTYPDAVYIDLLEAEVFTDLLANPQRLENYIPREYQGQIIIDEIQRVPELLNEVHRLIESKSRVFILTGSNARKLRRAGHNLLAGRALTYFLHPLTALETGKDFDMEKAILIGQLPSVYREADPKKYLESYVKTYLEQEIQQEGLTRNLSAFVRFLEVASFSHGSVLNISEVARESAIERKVAENYFMILEDLLIGYRVSSFTKKAKRRVVQHPKFYFFDTGIYRTIRPSGPLDRPEEKEGAALEGLVFQELFAINDYQHAGYTLQYFQTPSGHEVDFVLYGPRGIRAFEVKRSSRIMGKMLRGLRVFLREYPQAKAYCLYGGKRRMRDGDIDIIPISDALKALPVLLQ